MAEKIDQISEAIGRIEERTIQMDRRLENIESHIEKQNGQINEIKQWRASLKGAMGVIAGIVSFLVTVASIVVAKLFGF